MSDSIYTDSLREANEINRSLLKKLVETENKLEFYESGFKGACPTCEAVGELNVDLEKKLAKAVEGLKKIESSSYDLDSCDDARQILKEIGELWEII